VTFIRVDKPTLLSQTIPMPANHRFTINGIKWLWRYTRLRGCAAGWTFFENDASPGTQKVLIDDRLKGRVRLETEAHEFLHAANPTICEEHITQQAAELARILWALGYRRI